LKKLHIESDIVLHSERGSIKVDTSDDRLTVHFEDWTTVSFFFNSAKGSFSNLKRWLGLTKNLHQRISVEVESQPAITIYDGKIERWKFGPIVKLFFAWLRSS